MVGPWLSEHTDMRDWLNTTKYDQLEENLARWTEEPRTDQPAKRRANATRPKKSERAIKRKGGAAKAAAIAEQEREENAVGERTTDPRPNRTGFLARVSRLARGVLVFPVRRFFFPAQAGLGLARDDTNR